MMTAVTASMVKALRDKTGAGMMDCKAALTETDGDMENAIDWLRKKGLSKAAKKADRVAAEGLIGLTAKDNVGAIVEVNSETDFVARNPQFQDMVRGITRWRRRPAATWPSCWRSPIPARANGGGPGQGVVATIGENMSVRRTGDAEVKEGVVGAYVHGKAARASARSACWSRSRARATRQR